MFVKLLICEKSYTMLICTTLPHQAGCLFGCDSDQVPLMKPEIL